MKFNVTVKRTEAREHTFLVEEKDREAAFHKGLDAAYNHDFKEDRADESSEDVETIVEVK
jgi:hypothetical protein